MNVNSTPSTSNQRVQTPRVRVIFTLDYEIHGNGDGCPLELMVEPTERMLREFDRHGAKLTILADIGEILKFKEHFDRHGTDDFHYRRIADQLRSALKTGHDVQLHIHSGYFNAQFQGGRWKQDWSEYNFAGLPLDRMTQMVRLGKEWLESLLQPVNPGYRCRVFRAANWSVHPSANVIRALASNGIDIDTSVFKFGRRDGLVTFNYENAPSEALPWMVDPSDVCRQNPNGPLAEFPIYTERRWISSFLTVNRLYRALLSRRHKVQREGAPDPHPSPTRPSLITKTLRAGKHLLQRHAWKADFNQCTGSQLIAALKRCEARHRTSDREIPFVLIGHSKLYTPANERSLRPFLKFVSTNPSMCDFAVFADCRGPENSMPASRRGMGARNSQVATASG